MREDSFDRRAYLRGAGAAGLFALTGTAGCVGGNGGGGSGGSGSGGNSNQIVPGTAPGFPPFEMKEGGEIVGFDIDLLSAVVAETDYQLGDWQAFEFGSLIPALTNDKIDAIAAAMTINEERDETIDFSNPYYNADQSVLVRGGGSFSPSALADLSGHPVGAQEGTTGESQVKTLVENGTLQQSNYNSYGNYVLAVKDLTNGNIDAIVLDKPVAETFVEQRPVEIAFTVETGERYGFGMRTDDDDLTQALNEGLEAVRESGQYEEIRNEWFGSNGG